MIIAAAFSTAIILLAAFLYVLQECTFLIPYRQLILSHYLPAIGAFLGVLALNLFSFFYLLIRTLFLKNTGQKLAHLEKELRTGGAISEELAQRLEE